MGAVNCSQPYGSTVDCSGSVTAVARAARPTGYATVCDPATGVCSRVPTYGGAAQYSARYGLFGRPRMVRVR